MREFVCFGELYGVALIAAWTGHPHFRVIDNSTGFEEKEEGECYKPNHTRDNPQGGLGGVGVENWIIQNGGSFRDAAMEFLKAAEGKTYDQFAREYYIWDFGENHFAVRNRDDKYKHDNFVYGNMSKTGFYKMVDTLNKFFETNIQAGEDYTGRIWVE